MLFNKTKPPQTPKGPEAARREIIDVIERHLSNRQAVTILEGLAHEYRIASLNSAPSLTTPLTTSGNLPPKPKIISALTSLIAGKTA